MFNKVKENLKKTFFSLSFFSVGILILFSLVTSSSDDNNLLKFDSTKITSNNILGYFGSVLSDMLLKVLGMSSYLICLFLFISSLRIFRGKVVTWLSWTFLPLSIVILSFIFEFISKKYSIIDL